MHEVGSRTSSVHTALDCGGDRMAMTVHPEYAGPLEVLPDSPREALTSYLEGSPGMRNLSADQFEVQDRSKNEVGFAVHEDGHLRATASITGHKKKWVLEILRVCSSFMAKPSP